MDRPSLNSWLGSSTAGRRSETLKAIYWGESGENAHQALQPGDQLILQGQLKITKVTHKTGEEEFVEQQASLMVEKINRIHHAS